jgi:hypothetical protein
LSQKYSEGDWFTVPVGRDELAVGLLARRPKRGTLCLAYFFGPARRDLPKAQELQELKATDAIFLCRLKDAALHRGLWRVCGSKQRWRHKDWPMPSFLRKEGLSGRAIRVAYDPDNLTTPAGEVEATAADMNLPEDVVYDDRRLVATLAALLSAPKLVTLDPGLWTR